MVLILENDVKDMEPEVIIKEVEKLVNAPAPKEDSWMPKVIIPIGTLCAGIVFGKYGAKIVKVLKTLE